MTENTKDKKTTQVMQNVCLPFEEGIVELEQKIAELKTLHKSDEAIELSGEIKDLKKKYDSAMKETFSNLTPWQRVQVARHPNRPYMMDYIEMMCEDFIELSGDRLYGDDKAIVTGFAKIGDKKVAVIGHQKGRGTKENLYRHFGSAHPEGYRKAMRIMKLAERFNLPVVTFIDTPGAYPGIGAEERGQAEAIAVNLREMAGLKTPVIAVIIGEGGSGGALGIGVANRVLMLENAYYSVISPEGCAAILWKDGARASDAAEALKLTAAELHKRKLIDDIVKEPIGGAHRNQEKTAKNLQTKLEKHLEELSKLTKKQVLDDRYDKFRSFGVFNEKAAKKKVVKKKAAAKK